MCISSIVGNCIDIYLVEGEEKITSSKPFRSQIQILPAHFCHAHMKIVAMFAFADKCVKCDIHRMQNISSEIDDVTEKAIRHN